jgi:signal transduction histidine kinase
MKNQFQTPDVQAIALPSRPISLHELINRVAAGLLPQAIGKRSFIINEADDSLFVSMEEDILAFVVGGLISNAVCSTSHACIRIETARNDRNVQVVIRNNGSFTYSPNTCSLTSMLGAARKLGGGISLKSEPGGGFSVALSIAAAA